MPQPDNLYELVHSLTPSEKRYFKVYLKRNSLKGSNNYELLFDKICKLATYNGALLKQQLKGTSVEKNLSVTKHYLYDHILKSLEYFYYQSGIDKKLSSYKTQIKLLQDRGLYQQAKKLTDKALKLATTNERFIDVAELTRWQSKTLTHELELRNLDDRLNTLHTSTETALSELQKEVLLEYLDNRALLLVKKYGIVRDEEGVGHYRSLVQHPAMNADNLTSFLQQYFYHHIMSLYHFATEHAEENYDHRKALVSLFAQKPEKQKLHESKYITALNNLTLVCNQQGKAQEFKNTLATLESIEAQTAEDRARVFTNSRTMWLMDAFGKKKYVAIVKRSDEILHELNAFASRVDLSNRILFYYLLAAAHLAAKRYKESLKLLYQLLETPRAEEIQDLYRFARILLLMAHYNLGNEEVLETQTKSLYSYLRSKKKMYRAESLLLDLIKTLIRVPAKEEKDEAFNGFRTAYAKLMQDPYESRVSSYFPFGDWAKS